MKHFYRLFMGTLLFIILSGLSFGQMRIGLDTYNRYIWRGVDYGNSPSFQPSISFTTGGFSLGAWGAFSTASTFAENDLWASYGIPTSSGTFTLYYTDYFYPSNGIKFFKYEDDGLGAHTLEAGLGYSGPEPFPVSASVYYNFFNDVDKSVYIQISYPFVIDSVYSLTVFAAGTPAKSAWYTASKSALINVGVTVTKSIKITDEFSLPVSASYILNPEIEQSYLIFGISL